jgi:hypothetical protein
VPVFLLASRSCSLCSSSSTLYSSS